MIELIFLAKETQVFDPIGNDTQGIIASLLDELANLDLNEPDGRVETAELQTIFHSLKDDSENLVLSENQAQDLHEKQAKEVKSQLIHFLVEKFQNFKVNQIIAFCRTLEIKGLPSHLQSGARLIKWNDLAQEVASMQQAALLSPEIWARKKVWNWLSGPEELLLIQNQGASPLTDLIIAKIRNEARLSLSPQALKRLEAAESAFARIGLGKQ